MPVVDGLAPAWAAGYVFPFPLPVYHSWRFQTGNVSSFRQAVSELGPVATLPPTVGVRALDVSSPGALCSRPPTGGTDPMCWAARCRRPSKRASAIRRSRPAG